MANRFKNILKRLPLYRSYDIINYLQTYKSLMDYDWSWYSNNVPTCEEISNMPWNDETVRFYNIRVALFELHEVVSRNLANINRAYPCSHPIIQSIYKSFT